VDNNEEQMENQLLDVDHLGGEQHRAHHSDTVSHFVEKQECVI
jgi:hypothetical protein